MGGRRFVDSPACVPPISVDRTLVRKGNKVEWFRARLDAKQWREEVEILDEELSRTAAFFTRMSELWNTLANRSTLRGYSEYAHQKADMFARRSNDAKEWHKWAVGKDIEQSKSVDLASRTCYSCLLIGSC